jgi:tRNA U34 2-thiouridine synthase MnmA/TrmU
VKHQFLAYNVIKQLSLEILYEYSKELGADALITGHYVNSIHNDGISEMYRAKDHERDQSYFYSIPAEIN